MPDTSGPSSPVPSMFYDPDSSCWRTSQATFLSDSTECSGTLPSSGSMRSGALYERAMLAPAIDVPDCSLSLPTPVAGMPNDGEAPDQWQARRDRHASKTDGTATRAGLPLSVAVRRLPTPTTAPTTGNGHARNLDGEIRSLPTPAARDHKGRDLPSRSGGMSLPEAMSQLVPTPTVNDARGGRNRTSGRTNPDSQHHDGTTLVDWIWLLDGVTTAPRSSDTSVPWDEPPLTPPTSEGD